MEKIMKFWYNEEEEEIEKYKYLIMLVLKEKELEILSKNDKVVKKYMDRLNKINSDIKFREYMSIEEDERKIRNSEIAEAKEEGIEFGIGVGIEQTAKNMLIDNMSVEMISKYTGLSIDKIEKLN